MPFFLLKEIILFFGFEAKNLLKLLSSSYVSGKVSYGSLQINESGKLVGEIEFKNSNIVEEEFKDWKTI